MLGYVLPAHVITKEDRIRLESDGLLVPSWLHREIQGEIIVGSYERKAFDHYITWITDQQSY